MLHRTALGPSPLQLIAGGLMPILCVGRRRRVTIPITLRRELGVGEGDQ